MTELNFLHRKKVNVTKISYFQTILSLQKQVSITETSFCPSQRNIFLTQKKIVRRRKSYLSPTKVSVREIDRVGPVDNRPGHQQAPPLCPKEEEKNVTCNVWYVTCYMWHMTCVMCHVTCETWHMTCNMWHVTHGGRWTFSQNFRSLAHTVWEWRCLEDLEEKDESVN